MACPDGTKANPIPVPLKGATISEVGPSRPCLPHDGHGSYWRLSGPSPVLAAMTLANVRGQGVRSLWVKCELCHHEAVVNVDAYAETVPVPAFGPRMVCTSCGIVGAFARPHWQERQPEESLTGRQWR
jgi:hypothetical protein